MLKNEITVVGDQCEKQREAKEVLATLNTAYKKQVGEKIEQYFSLGIIAYIIIDHSASKFIMVATMMIITRIMRID